MFLQKNKFHVRETLLDDYLLVFFKNPEGELKKIFPQVRVFKSDAKETFQILKETTIAKYLAPKFKPGDAVRINDPESTLNNAVGVIDTVTDSFVQVTVTVWGMPFKAEVKKEKLVLIKPADII